MMDSLMIIDPKCEADVENQNKRKKEFAMAVSIVFGIMLAFQFLWKKYSINYDYALDNGHMTMEEYALVETKDKVVNILLYNVY